MARALPESVVAGIDDPGPADAFRWPASPMPATGLSAVALAKEVGSPVRSITAFPSPETPSLSFTKTCLIEGFFARICAIASIRSSLLPRFS